MKENITVNQKKAFLYCRTAHPDMDALKLQKEPLIAYAEAHGFVVAGIATENGSGLDYSRPGLQEALAVVGDGKADILLVKSFCRLGRDMWKNDALLHWLNERGVELVCADGSEPQTFSEMLDMLLKEHGNCSTAVH